MVHLINLGISKEVSDRRGKEMAMALEHPIRSTELQDKMGQVLRGRLVVSQDLEMEMVYSQHMVHLIVGHHLDEGMVVLVLVLGLAKHLKALMDLLPRVLGPQVARAMVVEVGPKVLQTRHTALRMLVYNKGLLVAHHHHRMALLALEVQVVEDKKLAGDQVVEEALAGVDPAIMEVKMMSQLSTSLAMTWTTCRQVLNLVIQSNAMATWPLGSTTCCSPMAGSRWWSTKQAWRDTSPRYATRVAAQVVEVEQVHTDLEMDAAEPKDTLKVVLEVMASLVVTLTGAILVHKAANLTDINKAVTASAMQVEAQAQAAKVVILAAVPVVLLVLVALVVKTKATQVGVPDKMVFLEEMDWNP